MSNTLLKYPKWQESVLRAVLETKTGELSDKIRIAEAAISERVETMKRVKWDADEYRALNQATNALNSLK